MVLRRDSVVGQLGVPIQEINARSNLGTLVGRILALPGLRGFWPTSSVDSSQNMIDISGQGRNLTNANMTITNFSSWSGLPFAFFNGSNQRQSRADEAGLDITGNLTIGCIGFASVPATSGVYIGKWDGSTNQLSYCLGISSDDFLFAVSGNGSTTVTANIAGYGATLQRWSFLVGRYIPSTSVAAFVNGVWNTNTTSIPSSIFNSSAALTMANHNSTTYFNCGISMAFLCSYPLEDSVIEELYDISRAFIGSA